jgi:hypothetical protein
LRFLEQGGEVAQGVVRELFPDGIWLYPDPHGGAFLWACAQTALPADCITRVDDKGFLPAEVWPRVYNVTVENPRTALRVDGSGSGGPIWTSRHL